jgi:transforming growth factor-beta-induced protein
VNKMWKTVLVLVVVLLMGASVATASGHETIVDIAAGNDNFDTLVAAVVAADLADALSGGSWTVFAPTDAAFAKLGLNADNIASSFTTAELTDILLYHVLPAPVSSAEAKASVGDIVMGNGQKAGLKFFDGSLYVNDDAKVIAADIVASNGVIHVVDTVILGPWPRSATGAPAAPAARPAGNTIVDIAVGNGNFDTLVAAVVAAGLADALSSGSWTVFAPTDAAFAKLGLNASNIASAFTTAELTDILLYHVLTTPVSSFEAKASTGDIVMGNGQKAGLKVFQGDLYVNDDAKVIIADVVASNGVIHAVDTVILGPWPR